METAMASRDKLPVPGPWQSAVRAAIADVVHRDKVLASAVTVTRVDPAPAGGLDVWLLVAGRTRRYRVGADGYLAAPAGP
jgi:hypothetical protein